MSMNNVIKRNKIFSHLRQLNADIAFLQETHILNSDVIKLRRSWGGQVFHSSFNAKGRGTAILIRKSISFTSEKVISDSSGRYVIVTGRLLDRKVILVNIYAPNFDDSNFFSKVFTSIPPADDYALIIGGDFNCVLNTSLDRSSSRVIQPSKAAINIKHFCDQFGLLDPWRFLFPSSRTFSFFSPVHHSYSRIDFFLVDKSIVPFVSSSMYHSIVISDHAPSSFVLSLPTQHSSFKPWRLNTLLLADEEFITFLTKEINMYLELNDRHDISRSVLWEALKAYLRGKIISFSSYAKKQELSKLRNISEAINRLDEQYAISPCPRLYKERE